MVRWKLLASTSGDQPNVPWCRTTASTVPCSISKSMNCKNLYYPTHREFQSNISMWTHLLIFTTYFLVILHCDGIIFFFTGSGSSIHQNNQTSRLLDSRPQPVPRHHGTHQNTPATSWPLTPPHHPIPCPCTPPPYPFTPFPSPSILSKSTITHNLHP